MSIDEPEQSNGVDEDSQPPKKYMPEELKEVADREGYLREILRYESLNHCYQMKKVPAVLRLENDSNDYDPLVVALGPYHHCKENLLHAEKFKVKALQHIIVDTGKSVQFFFDEVFDRQEEKYDDEHLLEQHVPCFRSASDLKAKGIHFRPSRGHSLADLCFRSGYYYAQLQLPIMHVSTHTKAFFSNLIAYESCLESPADRKVTAYIKFMKSLIVHADDVKELRQKGILFTSLGSDEEVLKMFKELNTSTLSTEDAFENVRKDIQKHFRSKFKSWLGEFLYTYFRSAWTAIGTIAAIILLLLTLVQTYFTIRCS